MRAVKCALKVLNGPGRFSPYPHARQDLSTPLSTTAVLGKAGWRTPFCPRRATATSKHCEGPRRTATAEGQGQNCNTNCDFFCLLWTAEGSNCRGNARAEPLPLTFCSPAVAVDLLRGPSRPFVDKCRCRSARPSIVAHRPPTLLWSDRFFRVKQATVFGDGVTVGHAGNVIANDAVESSVSFGDCSRFHWQLRRLLDKCRKEGADYSISLGLHPHHASVRI